MQSIIYIYAICLKVLSSSKQYIIFTNKFSLTLNVYMYDLFVGYFDIEIKYVKCSWEYYKCAIIFRFVSAKIKRHEANPKQLH